MLRNADSSPRITFVPSVLIDQYAWIHFGEVVGVARRAVASELSEMERKELKRLSRGRRSGRILRFEHGSCPWHRKARTSWFFPLRSRQPTRRLASDVCDLPRIATNEYATCHGPAHSPQPVTRTSPNCQKYTGDEAARCDPLEPALHDGGKWSCALHDPSHPAGILSATEPERDTQALEGSVVRCISLNVRRAVRDRSGRIFGACSGSRRFRRIRGFASRWIRWIPRRCARISCMSSAG